MLKIVLWGEGERQKNRLGVLTVARKQKPGRPFGGGAERLAKNAIPKLKG